MNHLKNFEAFNESNNPEFNYQMLSRLQSDCEYFLNNGKGSVRGLYYDTIEEHISAMKELWSKLSEKPEWLSMEEIEEYEQRMLNYTE